MIVSVLLLVGGLGVGALAIAGWVAAVASSAPNLNQLKPRTPGQLSEVFAANGQRLGFINSTVLRTPVSGTRIPQVLKNATIAIEDRRFYHHGALDYTGILRAAIRDVFNGGSTLQGASTLTMQLANALYVPLSIEAHHNLRYKIIQAKLAEQLESAHTKDWILDSYLNDVPYGTVGGQTAYGVGAASQLFFDKPVWKLDLAQAALLAGLPQAPSEYNPLLYPSLARQRRHDVLQAMVRSRYITQAQASAANAEPLQVKRSMLFDRRNYQYAFDYIVQELHQRFCPHRAPTAPCAAVDQGGLKIYSTIQPRDEEIAQSAILSHEGGPGQPAAALASVDPGTGNIVAIANSSTYQKSSFDYATQGHRQPGSSFKAFVLMTLIHDYDGDPAKTFYNSHFLAPGWLKTFPTWSVHTAEQTYQGVIDVTKATIISDNTVFAQLDVDLGPKKVAAMAHKMGIISPLQGIPAESIGGLKVGVTPLEMADAYATLADGGVQVPPRAVSKVVFPDGRTVNFTEPHNRAVTPGEAYEETKILKQVILQGTGTAANYGCPAAGKTGTAENLANAWFVGYTPKLSTAVWVGYPTGNIPMSNGFGGALAAPIWHDFMAAASNGYCGGFTPASWTGTPFTGPHSASSGSHPNGASQANVPLPPSGAYTNPQLFAAPPQGPPPVVPGVPPPSTKPKTNTGPKSVPPTGGGGGGGGHGPGSGGGPKKH